MITYLDTSVLLELLVDDEVGASAVQRLWLESDFVVCAEIGYAEARAALARHIALAASTPTDSRPNT